jgi:hypothetical protein
MNIDQGSWEQNPDSDPFTSQPSPPPVPSKDNEDNETERTADVQATRQYDPVRAFGKSLWNASTLALAVESRTRGVSNTGSVVCIPGEF